MKNKISKYIALTIISFLIFQQLSNSSEIKFESETIETINKDLLIARGNIKISNDIGYEIKGLKLELNNNLKIHNLSGNVVFYDGTNNYINSDKLIIDENTGDYIFIGKVKIKNDRYLITLTTDKIKFNQFEKIIKIDNYTKIIDDLDNLIETNFIEYSLLNNQLKSKKVKITDKDANIYEIDEMLYDLEKKEIVGKDISINRDNERLLNANHVPRSKSRSFIYNKNFLTLKKSVYTNCKKSENCPPWLITAEEITHDKKKKTVNYKNSTLKFFNTPIIYFPKFFHPDPSVDRQTGFLTPQIALENSNSYLNLPYYIAIADNSDLTFSPRFYDNQEVLYQTEYRKENKYSSHILDLGIANGNFFLTKKDSTQSYFFLDSEFETKFNFFDVSKLDLKLETVSNENFLKAKNINSDINNSNSILNSEIILEGYSNNLDFSISAEIFEDLTVDNGEDRYEYILPNLNLNRTIPSNLSGVLEFNSSGYNKIYDANINEKILINDINFKSLDYFSKIGFVNNYDLIFKNFNSEAKNSKNFDNNLKSNLQAIVQFNSKFPLTKENDNYIRKLTPIVAAKFNPSSKNKNISETNRFIDYSNIYSINRLGSSTILEGGNSITIGNEYKIFNKKNMSEEIFGLSLASSIRNKENHDLPYSTSLNQKTSDIFGNANFRINDILELEYNFITKNNLKDFNYHKINSDFRVNNFVTTFEYLEEKNLIGSESFVSNTTSYEFNQNQSLIFSTRKNKKINITEYYDLIYQYKMDCLTAGLQYKKNYYRDGSLKPEEKIFFSITFMPFNNTVNLPDFNK